jgi:hypothetical protein
MPPGRPRRRQLSRVLWDVVASPEANHSRRRANLRGPLSRSILASFAIIGEPMEGAHIGCRHEATVSTGWPAQGHFCKLRVRRESMGWGAIGAAFRMSCRFLYCGRLSASSAPVPAPARTMSAPRDDWVFPFALANYRGLSLSDRRGRRRRLRRQIRCIRRAAKRDQSVAWRNELKAAHDRQSHNGHASDSNNA